MNRLYIDGMIASEPVFKMEPGGVPHLTFRLGVRHKTRSGAVSSSAWRGISRSGRCSARKKRCSARRSSRSSSSF